MNLEELVILMKAKSYLLEMGAGKLAKNYRTTRENIYKAKDIVRQGKIATKRTPKILILDIETAPIKAWVWGRWKQNISPDAVISDWFMLGYSCKWFNDSEIHSDVLTGNEVLVENDSRIVRGIWKFLNQADFVVCHNGNMFDIPRIKSRFIIHGLPPTTFYQQIDTLKIARKEFGFSSNKLDVLAKLFGFDGKFGTTMELWVECMNGNEESLQYMRHYNEQDVVVLENIYRKMIPFIKSHPNHNLYTESKTPICPSCGGEHLIKDGEYYTQSGRYNTFRCLDCGGISRERKTTLAKDKKLLLSIPGR